MAKVFDIESPLEARCKETAERRNKRCETRHDQNMKLKWSPRNIERCVAQLHDILSAIVIKRPPSSPPLCVKAVWPDQ